MNRGALAGLALVLACCNANDVLLYGPAAAGAGDVTGEGAAANQGPSQTGGTDAMGGTSTTGGTNTGGSSGAEARGGTTGGANATGGTNATGGSGDAGSGGTEPLTPCFTNTDCSSTYYCSKASCGDEQGVCLPTPVFCDVAPAPVCGCDDVTYWNACVRAAYGVGADRECGAHPPCQSDEDCGTEGLTCAHLLRQGDMSCNDRGGTCWGIPFACMDSDMDAPRWLPCLAEPPGMNGPMGPPPKCVSTCEAIQSGAVYVQAPRNYPCQ